MPATFPEGFSAEFEYLRVGLPIPKISDSGFYDNNLIKRIEEENGCRQATCNEVNRIINMVETIMTSHASMFNYGSIGWAWGHLMILMREFRDHIIQHRDDGLGFYGFSISCNYQDSRVRIGSEYSIACSCGKRKWNIPQDIYDSQIYGLSFNEFLQEMNWAYMFVVNETNYLSKKDYTMREIITEERQRRQKIEKKLKERVFDNPISELEV